MYSRKVSVIIRRKLKVGFFASSFVGRNGSGTAVHAEQTIKNICEEHREEVKVYLFCNTAEQFNFLKASSYYHYVDLVLLPNVRGKHFRSLRQYFWYSLRTRDFIDVLHFMTPRFYPFFWVFPARKFICTFHAGGDITASSDKIVFSRHAYNLIAKLFYLKLDAIVAVSEQGKNEISSVYKIQKSLIDVIYSGTDDKWNLYRQIGKPSKVSTFKFFEIPKGKKVVLVIGRWQRYKNIQVVSEALRNDNNSSLEGLHFIFLGKKIDFRITSEIFSDLSRVDRNAYSVIEYLSDIDYSMLIKMVDLVIFPSLNEGFGLPAFDAFSQGTPVLIHKDTPAAEILKGQPGVFAFDLSSSNMLLKKIKYVLKKEKSNGSKSKKYLVDIGAIWAKSTEQYLSLYVNVTR